MYGEIKINRITINQVDILNKNILNSSLKIFKGRAHNIHLEETR